MPNLSIKQIAESIGVPKIKVYKYIKANNIKEAFSERSTLLYDEQSVDKIMVAFSGTLQSVPERSQERSERGLKRPENAPECSENALDRSENALENTLGTVIGTLTEQLKVKDEQLVAKDKQIEQLTAALSAAQETQQQLTNSLTAAQALHAGTIQQQLVDKSNKGFFSKIFKKKGEK